MINAEGSLTINDFRAEDVGNYTCGASNEFKTRTSKTAAVSMAGKASEVPGLPGKVYIQ